MMAMKTMIPASAWSRGLMVLRRRNTAVPRPSASAAAASRSGVACRRSAIRDRLEYQRPLDGRRVSDGYRVLQQPLGTIEATSAAVPHQQNRVTGADRRACPCEDLDSHARIHHVL